MSNLMLNCFTNVSTYVLKRQITHDFKLITREKWIVGLDGVFTTHWKHFVRQNYFKNYG